jgi:preprotein translocase subunit SecF
LGVQFFGIDFRGGTLIEIETTETENLGNLRRSLNSLNLGDVQVQEFGSPKNILILRKTKHISSIVLYEYLVM